MANATPEQVAEWVPQCFRGENDKIQIAAFGVSEPDAGSDVSSLRTRAVYDEAKDEWVLNGTKTWITNGGIADIHVIVASIDPTLGSQGQASFIVRLAPGIRQGQKFKHGIRASHTARSSSRTAGSPATASSAARTSSTSAWPAPARARRPRSRRRWRRSRRPARRSAPSRRHRPGRL